jgi:acetyl esterase/lipase
MKAITLLTYILLIIGVGGVRPACAQTLTYRDIEKLPRPAALRRLAYGTDPLQFGDLRLPEGRGPHPVAVIIHGGCWYSEYDLNHIAGFAAALTRLGLATWTIEYRRVGNPGGGWPGTFADAAQATDYLRELARSYPLDLNRVITVGHSAGGQLALWLAARRRLPQSSPLYADDPLRVAGVLSLAGITDMYRFSPRCGDAARRVLGGSVEEVPQRYGQTSPVELLPFGVRQLLLHGTLDSIVPLEMGMNYKAAAEKKGEDVKFIPINGAGHFELIAPQSAAWPMVEGAVRSLLGLRG